MTRRLFFAAGPLLPLAARNWDRSAFPDWSGDQVDKLLTDSPWARPLTLPFRFSAPPRPFVASEFYQIGEPLGLPKGWPSGGSGNRQPRIGDGPAPPAQAEIYLTVRWASALPMRQAMALHQFGRGGLTNPNAAALLGEPAGEYVIEAAGFPVGMLPQGARRFEAELLAAARLQVKGRSALRATAASVPEHGNHLIATLRFPRYENLSADDGFIEFAAVAGPMDIRQKFKLREMSYKGRLEL